MAEFVHLHNHSQYSLLDGAAKVKRLVEKTVEYGQKAFAITDHGNLFAVPEFWKRCTDQNIKPIIGSEFYITPTSMYQRDTKERYHLILLAKNLTGYKNLIKLSTQSFLDGYYYKPRIDREILRNHSDGLIALTACIKGEVPNSALKGDFERSRRLIDEYVDIFGDDFYLELQNHGIREEEIANKALIEFAKEKNVKLVATNDIHYVEQSDSDAHDILLCLATGKEYHDPTRMKFTTDQVFFKNSDQMAELFKHLPEAIENTVQIAESVELFPLFGDPILPDFIVPDSFKSKEDYLRQLCVDASVEKYGGITQQVEERLNKELKIIEEMGYAGYFLITQDFTNAARRMNVSVGPGRGSAAGSIVAYLTGITNIDPLKYNLLFERFLNPERKSMPDIDIDFDDKGRQRIIDYVIEKYGRESVTQIITFGTMAARGAIRDVGRALGVPLKEVDEIAKMIPEGPGQSILDAIEKIPELKEIHDNGPAQHKQLLEFAKVLEGSARHTSMHAAGVVITPGSLTNYVPLVKNNKDEITTQYDKDYVEKIGLLKMDFLGLKTLSILNDAIQMAKSNHNIEVDLDNLPEEDAETFALLQRGETAGIFQFESSGMQEYLKKLKPTVLEDLIAMNALYRPGPLGAGMVESFIKRKHGEETIDYLHPMLEDILKDTYGVIVYQEQVMQIAQVMSGYSLGSADLLRRAMGKKKKEEMDEQKKIFMAGASEKSVDTTLAEKIFDLMAYFAGYGFNKSHSAAYAVIAYQTAYLKAHFPAEFMAACMNAELNNTDKLVEFIHECRRMGIEVLPPDVNESDVGFTVVEGNIRFGLAAVKNAGQHAVESIIFARGEKGPFRTFFDFFQKIDLRQVNRKVIESLIQAGALDNFEGDRATFLASIDVGINYAQKSHQDLSIGQESLFGGGIRPAKAENFILDDPKLIDVEKWSKKEMLVREKEFLGFYVSGHVLDGYKAEYNALSTVRIDQLKQETTSVDVSIVCVINSVMKKLDRKQNQMAFIEIEDYYSSMEAIVFSSKFEELRPLIAEDKIILLKGKFDGSSTNGQPKILVDDIQDIESAVSQKVKSLNVLIDPNQVNQEQIDTLKSLFHQYAGDIPVYFEIKSVSLPKPIVTKSNSVKVKPTQAFFDNIQNLLGEDSIRIFKY